MKAGRAGMAVIILTIAFVAFSAGFLSGRMTSGGTFTISTELGSDIGGAAPAFSETGEGSSRTGEATPPSGGTAGVLLSEPASSGSEPAAPENGGEKSEAVFPININTCGKDGLMQLPSIGETRAEAIMTYRETNGPFRSIADIMQVPGIGEAIYDDIKEFISVEDKK